MNLCRRQTVGALCYLAAMRRAALIYNPTSGGRRARRVADVEAVAAVLRGGGVEVIAVPTRAPGSAGEQAHEVASAGCEAVLACGGDGTVHDVLQGVVGSPVALGVVPLGTGNALATDLGLSRDPAQAARQLLTAEPRRIAVGRIEYQEHRTGQRASRFFTVIAGVGADAQMLYSLNLAHKQRYGMAAYYAMAARLFASHALVPFEIELNGARVRVFEVMAVRVRQFGGVLRRLAPEAGLERDDLTFVLFTTSSRLSYGLYVARGFLEQRWAVPGVQVVHAKEAVCRALAETAGRRLYSEADGELLGNLPTRLCSVPDALTLLFPQK